MQSVISQALTAVVTGNSFKLDIKSMAKGAITAGVLSYANGLADVSKVGLGKTATKVVQRAVDTTLQTGIQSVAYGTDFKKSLVANLSTAGVDIVAKEAFSKVGDVSMKKDLVDNNKSFEDGGIVKTFLHTATGAGIAAINGDNILAGALSAGSRELISPLTKNSSKASQLLISQLTGILAGGLVGGDSGAKSGMTIATAGEEYNRQLHEDEIKFITEKSKDYAKQIYNTDNPTDKEILKSQQILYIAGKYYNDRHTKAWEDAKLKEVGLKYTKQDLENAFEYLKVNSKGLTFTDEYKGIATSKPQQYFTSTKEQYKDSSWTPDSTIGMGDQGLPIFPVGRFGQVAGKEVVQGAEKSFGEATLKRVSPGSAKKVESASAVKAGSDGVDSSNNLATDVKKVDLPNTSNDFKTVLEDKYGAQNVAKISKDEITGRQVIETTQGSKQIKGDSKSGWNKLLNNPEPNTDYKFNDSVYKTDDLGRVQEASFSPNTTSADRSKGQQTKAGKTDGIKDGLPNDQGGHLNAAQNGGAGEQINYLPQDALLNNGSYKSLENTWNKATAEGKKVDVTIKPIYEGTSKRPSKFEVDYTIGGEIKYETFHNTPTGDN